MAVEFLERAGLKIREVRLRTPLGELDIVAEDGETIVFIEVKSRTTGTPGGEASQKVDSRKLGRICRMGEQYANENGLSARPLRVDVVTVSFGEGRDSIEHYRDVTAFRSAPR